MSRIQLAQGSGGEESQQLIRNLFIKHFSNPILDELDDAAILDCGTIAVSTDTFTVSPLQFPGGDIGKLAIAGSVNDVAMRAAQPAYLTVGFVIEEGLEIALLEQIVASMSRELQVSGAQIVSGDTKIVPRGAVDQLLINTTAIGRVKGLCGVSRIESADQLLLSGPIAEHGACIYAAREEIAISGLQSDCRTLWPAVSALLEAGITIHAMRDATRGGLAAVLNEWSEQRSRELWLEEGAVPLSDAVRGFAEILGIDPFSLACEGAFVIALPASASARAITALQNAGHPQATMIGWVGGVSSAPRVVLQSAYGTERLLEYPVGEILPRIC